MKKAFVEPKIFKINLNMTENIAMSQKEETTDVYGLKMRQVEGTPGGCQVFYVKTNHKVVDEFTIMDIYFGGCISAGSNAEQSAFRMMRR